MAPWWSAVHPVVELWARGQRPMVRWPRSAQARTYAMLYYAILCYAMPSCLRAVLSRTARSAKVFR